MANEPDNPVEYVRRGPRVHPDPRVSVVIPAWQPKALGHALDSVRQQTFEEYEIVVVDDGSPEPVAPAEVDDLVLCRQANTGPGGARNRGVALARGQWIALLDSDDQWRPEKLMHQLNSLADHPEVVLSATDYECLTVVTRQGRPAEVEHRDILLRERYGLAPGSVPFERLCHENCIPCSTAMVRRSAWLAAGGMHPTHRAAEEFGLWLRLGLRGEVHYLPELLTDYYQTAESLTGEAKRSGTWHAAELGAYHEFLNEFPEFRRKRCMRHALARVAFDRGWSHLEAHEWRAARWAFCRAIVLHPGATRSWRAYLRAALRMAGRPESPVATPSPPGRGPG